MRKLTTLLDAIRPQALEGPRPESVSALTDDSRAVEAGGMFVAVRGTAVDGHRYIVGAIERGASVVVCEEIPADIDECLRQKVLWVVVGNTARALGLLASRWWGDPSRALTLVGVTGTNGKTTIATLLYRLAGAMGEKAGLLSTVENRIGDERIAATHTTPGPLELQALLARMVEAGCSFCAMEVSSHAAAQHRIAGLDFSGGIFTNLTRDHLDYHRTFKAYLEAKKSFFDMLSNRAWALTNLDDANGPVMVQNTSARPTATYSLRTDADFRVQVVENCIEGMLLSFNGTEVETMFVGRFNASNLAAVYGAGVLLGYEPAEVLRAISALTPVAGRFQPFRSPEGITAIVDYAHTPDALENVLTTVAEVMGGRGRIITVCGCGGDRDKGKRPQMAATAAHHSSLVILTSDNPRSEDPRAIVEDMLAGLTDPCERGKVLVNLDRREAIRTAVAMAKPGDLVVVAGKGHETSQIIGGETRHFDDREEVAEALGLRPGGKEQH
ncbi:MAG: UDP-N-acetylmuramoyl-L-alanyl-D-glutamate--2,6-diaminopimelate ligase [Muribaculaceae bacterium]|nr:UDP-N-acetylmuramoyl-L-alanyl-D-glutamate--2,6-diaminopimelate ligase [Muribaculaceae bacterium]